MWNTKRDMINSFKLVVDIFGVEGTQVCHQYMKFYYYRLFVATFLLINLLYTSILISVINYIDCKVEEKIKSFTFASSIFNESLLGIPANGLFIDRVFNCYQFISPSLAL